MWAVIHHDGRTALVGVNGALSIQIYRDEIQQHYVVPPINITGWDGLRSCGAQLGTISVGRGSQSTCSKVCRIGRGALLGAIGRTGLRLALITYIYCNVLLCGLDKPIVDYTLAPSPPPTLPPPPSVGGPIGSNWSNWLKVVVPFSRTMLGHTLHKSAEIVYSKTTLMSCHGHWNTSGTSRIAEFGQGILCHKH